MFPWQIPIKQEFFQKLIPEDSNKRNMRCYIEANILKRRDKTFIFKYTNAYK